MSRAEYLQIQLEDGAIWEKRHSFHWILIIAV